MGIELKQDDEFHKLTRKMDEKRKIEASLENIKRIIGIHSGKGGVGKTFLTVNVAYALAERGYDVGVLDADVDCPNVPKFLGITSRLFIDKQKRFVPVNHLGVKVVSMGLTKDNEAEPILVRGPAKHRVAIDFLTNTDWGALDFLLVDLPPGTSDVPLSILEFGHVEGMIYVTSPQKDSIMDTKKSIGMGRTFSIPIIGIVENMSGYVFGTNKSKQISEEFEIPYLGTIPLSEKIVEDNERGDLACDRDELKDVFKTIVDAIIEPLETIN